MSLIRDSQMQDCRDLLRRRRRDVSDFKFTEQERPFLGTDIQATVGTITIQNKHTGIARDTTVETGARGGWILRLTSTRT